VSEDSTMRWSRFGLYLRLFALECRCDLVFETTSRQQVGKQLTGSDGVAQTRRRAISEE
jgi:hypothetical protein